MISIWCSEKLDGVAAAAIVMRHAMLSKLPAHFGGFLHPDLLTDELEEMAEDEHKLFFVLDASLSPDQLSLVEKINVKNKIVYWNTPDGGSVVPPAKIFDKGEWCAAELARRRFLPMDNIARELASLAREVKSWQLRDERASKLADLIAAEYNPVELITALAKGMVWNDHFEQAHRQYVGRKQSALEELMRSLVIKACVDVRFGFALASSVLNSADACQRVLDGHAGVDVAVVLYRDGRIVFRRRDGVDVDVKALAELFDGGGQPYAAGARLNRKVSHGSLQSVIFYVDQVLRNFFLSQRMA